MGILKLEDYGLGDVLDWAALIFPRVYREVPKRKSSGKVEMKREPLGSVFIKDSKFGERALWKLPAGHKKKPDPDKPEEKPDATPLETAMRELEGETGIKLSSDAFTYVGKWLGWRKDHWKILFTADFSEADRDWMHNHHPENEGEEPKFFTTDDFYAEVRAGKFMREHFDKLEEHALILPFDRDKHPLKSLTS